MTTKQASMTIGIIFFFSLSYPVLAESDPLSDLITRAYSSNPELRKLASEQKAAARRSEFSGSWPDPLISGNYFGKPIETRSGAQTGNVMLSQSIPWPTALRASREQVASKSKALLFRVEARKLEIKAQITELYYSSFATAKQIEINRAQSGFVGQLTKVALAKVKVGSGRQQDVSKASLEIARIAEDTAALKDKLFALRAKINALVDRSPSDPVELPRSIPDVRIDTLSKDWEDLFSKIKASHPEILSALEMTKSSDAGIRAADYKGMPKVKATLSWFFIDEQTAMAPSEQNEDAWAVGAGISLPIWSGKYRSLTEAAKSERAASQSSFDGAVRRLERDLSDYWSQARNSQEVLNLYRTTIVPQAKLIMKANQKAYKQGVVTFDQLIRDVRALLSFQKKEIMEKARFQALLAKIESRLGVGIDALQNSTEGVSP